MQPQHEQPTHTTPSQPAKARRRFLTGVLTGGILGSLLAGSLNVFSHTPHGLGGWRGHAHQREANFTGERLTFATDWILSRVHATDEQRQQVHRIVQETSQVVGQAKAQHQQHRQAFLEALGQTTIDRDALRTVRAAEVQLLDQASNQVLEALAGIAEILTPEQRTELLAFMAQFHH